MATNACARVTGIVLKTSERSGSKMQPDGSTKNWEMFSSRVLVGGEDVIDVGYPSRDEMPGRGEGIDVIVSIRQSGTFLNIDYVGPWTERHTEASIA